MKLLTANPEVEKEHKDKLADVEAAWSLYQSVKDDPVQRKAALRMWNVASRTVRLMRGEWPADVPVDRFPEKGRKFA